MNANKDKMQFRVYHQSLNKLITEIFTAEVEEHHGRIMEVFGPDLWFKISLDLFNRFMKDKYKKFIMEALDTEGKSTEYFLGILEYVIEETRSFFLILKENVFRANNLDLEAETDNIFSLLFNEFQKLYAKKELHSLEKTSSKFYTHIIDKIKNASQLVDDKDKERDKKPIMNKPKLQELY